MSGRIEFKRGDIVDVDLTGADGLEKMNGRSRGSRPCVIVQNDRGNAVSPLTQVVPMTDARQFKNYPVQVLVSAAEVRMTNSKASSVECGHLRTIDRRRVLAHRGLLSSEAMARVDAALRASLAL